MDRRGFLLGEFTLKVVISILAILLLIFLLFSLYSSFQEKSQLEKAEFTLEEVIERIVSVSSESGANELSFFMPNPNDWLLLYYLSGEPGSCGGEKCLCVCEKEGLLPWSNNQLEQCNEIGVCKKVSWDVIMSDSIKIPGDIAIKKEENEVSISERNE